MSAYNKYVTKSRGTTLEYSADGSTYTQLDGVVSIDPESTPRSKIEDSDLDDEDTNACQPGYRAPGTMTVRLKFDDTIFETLEGMHRVGHAGGLVYYWRRRHRLRGSQTTTKTSTVFQGYIAEVKQVEINVDDTNRLGIEFDVQLTGSLTYTKGS